MLRPTTPKYSARGSMPSNAQWRAVEGAETCHMPSCGAKNTMDVGKLATDWLLVGSWLLNSRLTAAKLMANG